MNISKILNSLENSWKRDEILLKIKNGLETDDIVNEFLISNEVQLKKLNSLLSAEDMVLLNHVEKLSICEAKLINKINDLNSLKIDKSNHTTNDKNVSFPNGVPTNRISLFMINWSNKFVVMSLLTISAIALSKQAWA